MSPPPRAGRAGPGPGTDRPVTAMKGALIVMGVPRTPCTSLLHPRARCTLRASCREGATRKHVCDSGPGQGAPDRQTDRGRQPDRQTDDQTEKTTEKQIDKQTDKQTEKQTNRQAPGGRRRDTAGREGEMGATPPYVGQDRGVAGRGGGARDGGGGGWIDRLAVHGVPWGCQKAAIITARAALALAASRRPGRGSTPSWRARDATEDRIKMATIRAPAPACSSPRRSSSPRRLASLWW